MTPQQRAAGLAFSVAVVFIVLQLAFGIQTGLAGLFVAGMAGGLLVGSVMSAPASRQ